MILCQRCNKRPASVQSQQLGPHGRPVFVHLCEVCFNELQLNNQRSTILDKYCRDLTRMASDGELDPVIGRDQEIERLVFILSRRTKNNPVLVGDPGVGKTAIVEGLTQRIFEHRVVETLRGKRVLSLDLPSMLAGSAHRGEFEQRFKKAIDETIQSKGQVILFIDEIHTIVGAGAAQGAIDAANMLKPSLARGEIQLIGATTFDEYRQIIEKDGALERRLQPVFIDEPSIEDTQSILRGLRKAYENHHHVAISDEAICEAVKLSSRYISDRFLPDKALDVLDEASAAVRIRNYRQPENLIQINKEIEKLEKLISDHE